MKLLIDIGNTNTSIALLENDVIRKRYFIHTSRKEVSIKSFKRLLGKNTAIIEDIIIASVVPEFLKIVKRSLKTTVPGVNIRVVGTDINVPMKIRYRDPAEVGQDRLVTAYAGVRIAGTPVLVLDFGTAVTFDLVNTKGEYEGGLIFPGVRLGLASLSENAALLPTIELKYERGFIGKDTKGSINRGILYGYAAMCDGIVDRFLEKYGDGLNIIATGGDSDLISKYSRRIDRLCPDLMFKGLSILSYM